MDVQTDHQIVAFGADRMLLFDGAGTVVVDCGRNADGSWTAKAAGVPDVTMPADISGGATCRQGAITAMINQALAASPGDGYSTIVPHGLAEMP
jgi:hypothetical protein